MTVPGGDSGENSPGGADQTWPEWGPPPSATGFEPPSAPSPGYPPPGVPPAPGSYLPPGAAPGSRPDYPPPGPPTGYPPPGYGAPPGYPPSGYPPSGYPPPGYPPPGYGPPAGYPPPGYGAPYPGGYAQPSGKTNGLAVTSLVTSIAGIVFAPLSVVGIVVGVIAFNQIKRSGEGGHGLAVAGVAVGAVSLVVGLILMLSLLQ